MKIDDATPYVRDPEPIAADLGDELVMLSVDRGKYFHCNESAALVWKLLEHPITAPHIDEELQRCFQVSADECRAESRAFLQLLCDRGLVRKAGDDPA